jgi:hypothetical protein
MTMLLRAQLIGYNFFITLCIYDTVRALLRSNKRQQILKYHTEKAYNSLENEIIFLHRKGQVEILFIQI